MSWARSIGGFAAQHHLAATRAEPLGEALGLGRLAGSVDAFDDDEKSLAHGSEIALREVLDVILRRWVFACGLLD